MFNSRNPSHREPLGAVPQEQPVHFRITVDRDLHCSAAYLHIIRDGSANEEKYGMFWCGMNGNDREWWECHYIPQDPGLYFYYFTIDTWNGSLSLQRARFGPGGQSTLEHTGLLWQLTVYEKDFSTPDWLSGGILYQIFPDRFYSSGKSKESLPWGRVMHQSWEESPEWRPNAKGEITNSDYFGGDLKGIEEKLPYLQSLGVTCIYLNPIFEAHSNHRYNTADYSRIDPLLGTEEDFSSLCREAKKYGIHILLDGVFSHTGSDSVYFNREGRYPGPGAYQDLSSPYGSWYTFRRWPDDYECWWNFNTLPNVKETDPQYMEYINGETGIVPKWLRAGASGWRLDVADELPDAFLDALRMAAKKENPDSLILGEVWEDASNKSAYGQRRRYLLGRQLDSVMNYPFRNAVLGFLTGASPADMMESILSVVENYPPQVLRLLMNHIGTHDTERALTVLSGEPSSGRGREWQSRQKLSPSQRERGLRLLRLAAALQFTLPGVPCIYYGDEAGMEGYRDPFNRAPYPWGKEDKNLIKFYQRLGAFRKRCSCLKEGSFEPRMAQDDVLAYIRRDENDAVFCAVNRSDSPRRFRLDGEWHRATALFGASPSEEGDLFLEPLSCTILHLLPEINEEPEEDCRVEPAGEPAPAPKTASELASAGPKRDRKT